MGLLLSIGSGALVGWGASVFVSGGNGLLYDIALGVAGALVGSFFIYMVGLSQKTFSFNAYVMLGTLLGATIFIITARVFRA